MDFDDDGRPRILASHAEDRTARVNHRCDSCEQAIKPGEKYHRIAWLTDEKRWQVVKYHMNCGGAAPDEGERNPLPPITGVPDEISF